MLILIVSIVGIVSFILGYLVCALRIPNSLAKMTPTQVRELAKKVDRKRSD